MNIRKLNTKKLFLLCTPFCISIAVFTAFSDGIQPILVHIEEGSVDLSSLSSTPAASAPQAGWVIGWNGSKWAPQAPYVDAPLSYQGTFNPATGMPDTTVNGADYFAVATGTTKIGSSTITWSIGDQAVYLNDAWTRIPSGGVQSFNGRMGAVSPISGDYSLTMLKDVNVTSPAENSVLTYSSGSWSAAPARDSRINALQSGGYCVYDGASINCNASPSTITSLVTRDGAGNISASTLTGSVVTSSTGSIATNSIISSVPGNSASILNNVTSNITMGASANTITFGASTSVLQFNGTVNFSGTVTANNFSGSLSGDVSGTQTATTVTAIRGSAVATNTPAAGQYLGFNGTNWAPTSFVIASSTSTGLLRSSDWASFDARASGTNDGLLKSSDWANFNSTHATVAAASSSDTSGNTLVQRSNGSFSAQTITATALVFSDNSVQTRAGEMSWQTVTSNFTAAVNNGYFLNSTSAITATLPATCTTGDKISIIGINTGGWTVSSGASSMTYVTTSVNTSSSISSTQPGNSLIIRCISNTKWLIDSTSQMAWWNRQKSVVKNPRSIYSFLYIYA